jgi:hypothetical protein
MKQYTIHARAFVSLCMRKKRDPQRALVNINTTDALIGGFFKCCIRLRLGWVCLVGKDMIKEFG